MIFESIKSAVIDVIYFTFVDCSEPHDHRTTTSSWITTSKPRQTPNSEYI